jgi:hypothetical protein
MNSRIEGSSVSRRTLGTLSHKRRRISLKGGKLGLLGKTAAALLIGFEELMAEFESMSGVFVFVD